MATWALALLLISVVQLPLSIAGLWLLIRNLDLGRQSNDNAAQALEVSKAQTRAYLACVGGTYELYDGRLRCFVVFNNVGNSLASNVQVIAHFRVRSSDFIVAGAPPTSRTEVSQNSQGEGAAIPTTKNGTVMIDWDQNAIAREHFERLPQRAIFFVAGEVTWLDVFGVEQKLAIALQQELVGEEDLWEGKLIAHN
jgi:hypothetical protein